MSETATVMGTDHSPHEAYVQVAGVSALQLPTKVLSEAMAASDTLRLHLLKYVQAMVMQLSTSIAAAGQTIDQRLARWLLMCHDRIDSDDLHLTHDFIGMMLSVRRAGVTGAMQTLDRLGLIVGNRGSIIIKDRLGLEQLAAGGHGLAEAEYERMVGVALRRAPDASHRTVIQGSRRLAAAFGKRSCKSPNRDFIPDSIGSMVGRLCRRGYCRSNDDTP